MLCCLPPSCSRRRLRFLILRFCPHQHTSSEFIEFTSPARSSSAAGPYGPRQLAAGFCSHAIMASAPSTQAPPLRGPRLLNQHAELVGEPAETRRECMQPLARLAFLIVPIAGDWTAQRWLGLVAMTAACPSSCWCTLESVSARNLFEQMRHR